MQQLTPPSIQDKRVLVRIDTDVPVSDGQVTDPTRLIAALPTLRLLISHASQITILGHLGRPEGQDPQYSLQPIASKLSELLGTTVPLSSSPTDTKVQLLENLRYDPREQEASPQYAKQLATNQDAFVFDAFAVAHRAATSTTEIAKILPSFPGLRLEQEIYELDQVLNSPKHPFLAIIGGAKIKTKLPVVENLAKVADHVFVGGKLPHEIQAENLSLPANVTVATMTESGLDISPDSATKLIELVSAAQLIVWNGPLGKFEDPSAQAGTQALCQALQSSQGYKVIGGGETIASVNKFSASSSITFTSVGGGAMLEYLSGKVLPAIAALN
jgi:phosphoglycerate kinase